MRLLGKIHGYYPTDPFQASLVDMIIDTFEEVYIGMLRATSSKKIKKLFNETIPRVMKILEGFFNSGWLVQDKLSIADFYIGGFYTNYIWLEHNSGYKKQKAQFLT